MFLVGIAGGSGSGKTTFAKKIIQRAHKTNNPTDVAILHLDSYYHSILPSHLKMHGLPNFDHPEAFDWKLLKEHLQILKDGGTVQVPNYDYHTSRRTEEVTPVGPCSAVLFEGIFALWDAELRGLFDLKIYLHVEADIRFIRRLHRDVRERGWVLDNIIRQYYDTVRPMHHEFLEPTKQYADIVVGEETDIAAEVMTARVNQAISKNGSSTFEQINTDDTIKKVI